MTGAAAALMVLGVLAIGAAVLAELDGSATGRWATLALSGLGLVIILVGASLLPGTD